ncbi:putative metalloprotease with PDZ domain [Flavobacteriaceae bacterium MAR_2010_72]|nr:putative metalloprotease with PDZ domain [Flavobacteriaceae bacterium MAR_2010_72]
MYRFLFGFLIFIMGNLALAQVSSNYNISFENAVHHEAHITATFTNLDSDLVEFRMSRSSPGRYALHEFVKNVYSVTVTDGKGKVLQTLRPNPYAWHVKGHDGTIIVSYTLFANHGDGTYAQIDETHAHLNIPATFMYVPELSNNEFEVTFNLREDLNWKVATQLKHVKDQTYYARDLQYFMDSPVEISNFRKRNFKVDGQDINFVLHDDKASDEDFDKYFEDVKAIVLQQKAVFGELPKFDYSEYTFLACYMPIVVGDGMEHRNSTILTTTRSLARGGIEQNIGTVAHEFFHCWNVERIRPQDLEPFNFEEANMSGLLWFAEGFTNYYDALSMCRAGVWSHEKYLSDMSRGFNFVWTSPGRQFFNPIEMSYQAPFVDAAKSVDQTNRENTFISYYSYGEMLGLALDLSLREQNLNLDDYMKLMWTNFGKVGNYYTVEELHQTLNTYAGKDFGDAFFNNYIYKSGMPNFERLFKNVGIDLKTENTISFGAFVRDHKLLSNPKLNSSAYNAGLQIGDKLIKVGDFTLNSVVDINLALNKYAINDEVVLVYGRYDTIYETTIKVQTDINYNLSFMNLDDEPQLKKIKQNKSLWLNTKE